MNGMDQFHSLFIKYIFKVYSCFNKVSFYSAATVQDLSEQLSQLHYLIPLVRSLLSFHYLPSCFLYYRSCSWSLCYSVCSYNPGWSYCVLSCFFNYWSCSLSPCYVIVMLSFVRTELFLESLPCQLYQQSKLTPGAIPRVSAVLAVLTS